MKKNKLLSDVISCVLQERHVPPSPKEKLINRLKAEIEKILRQPEAWGELLRRIESFYGIKDQSAKERAANDFLNDTLSGILDRKSFVIANVNIHPHKDENILKKIDQMIRNIIPRYGWQLLMATKRGDTSAAYVIDKNYSERVPSSDIPSRLYHITRIEDVEKILRKGILPKQASHNYAENDRKERGEESNIQTGRQYQPRVYVSLTTQLANSLVVSFQKSYDEFDPYIMLRIDTSKLMPGTKFYNDTEIFDERFKDQSMWTYTRIPADAVSVDPQDQEEYKEFLFFQNDDNFGEY